jgi:hypothetical protein
MAIGTFNHKSAKRLVKLEMIIVFERLTLKIKVVSPRDQKKKINSK